MKKWLLLLISFFEAPIVLSVVYFEPTYCVRGKLAGEAFCAGRPTSFWRAELERPQSQNFINDLFHGCSVISQPRPLSRLEQLLGYRLWDREPASDEFVMAFIVKSLERHDEAKPVLRELLDDPVQSTRLLAQVGLGMALEIDEVKD